MVIMIVYSLVNDSSYKQLDYVTIIGILETKGGSFFLYRRTIDIIFLKISWWSNIIRWQEGHVSCSIYIRYITVFKMNCHSSLFIKTTGISRTPCKQKTESTRLTSDIKMFLTILTSHSINVADIVYTCYSYRSFENLYNVICQVSNCLSSQSFKRVRRNFSVLSWGVKS